MNEYDGSWVATYTGKKLHFLNPQPDEICIEDIAHHLSLTCRFAGAVKWFYSVAEHSKRVAEIVPNKYKLLALLHDGGEYALTDMCSPVKIRFPEFKALENAILQMILRKYNVDPLLGTHGIVKEADRILLATEARDLMNNMNGWAALPRPLKCKIKPLRSTFAEALFLEAFYEYGGH